VLTGVSISWFKIIDSDATGISVAGAQDIAVSNGSISFDDSSRDTTHVAIKVTEVDPVPRTGRITISHLSINGFRLIKKAGAIHFTSSATERTTDAVAPLLVLTQGVGGSLKDGTYSYLATSVIDSVETPSRSPKSITIRNGNGRASITLRWEAIGTLYGSYPPTGYRIYGRQPNAEGLLVTLLVGSGQSWTDDGTGSPGGARPPIAQAALGHVVIGPGVTVSDTKEGSGVFFNTVWPHTSIVGDTIRGAGDHCIAFNSSVMYFEIRNNECVDFGTVGIGLSARGNFPTSFGRISGNRLWNHTTRGKTGIRLQNDSLLSEIEIDNNDLRGNANPIVVGAPDRGVRVRNNHVDSSNTAQKR
jgi:hypothetical protein